MHRRKKSEDVDVYVYIYNSRWWQLKHFFMFIPKIGEMIQFDEHIFQMGWNHQLELDESETKSDTPKIISKFRHFHTVDMLLFWWICSRYGKRVNNTMMIMFIHFWTNRTASLFVVYLQGMTCCKASLILNSNPSERSWFDSISILEMIRRSQDLSPVVGWNNIRDFWHFWWRFCFFHSHFGAVFFFCVLSLAGDVFCFCFVLRRETLSFQTSRRHMDGSPWVTWWNQAQWSKTVQRGAAEALPLRAVTCDEKWTNDMDKLEFNWYKFDFLNNHSEIMCFFVYLPCLPFLKILTNTQFLSTLDCLSPVWGNSCCRSMALRVVRRHFTDCKNIFCFLLS